MKALGKFIQPNHSGYMWSVVSSILGVSFVFQDAFMLDDTIYPNIAIGKDNCTRQEVEETAKAA